MLVCVVAAGFAQSVFAQPADPFGRLIEGDFRAADAGYSALQVRFEKGTASEFDLLDAYKVFYQQNESFSAILDKWVLQSKSSSAYLARGVNLRKRGDLRRGTDFIANVPREDVNFMEQMHTLAKKDLMTALQLNPKSYLALLHLLNIAEDESDDRAAREYLALGNAILPTNITIRARYLIHLTPKWGGSYAKMDAFIDSCRSQGLSPGMIDKLIAIKIDDQGFSAQLDGQMDRARVSYMKALTLAAAAEPRFRQDYLKYSLQICAEPQSATAEYCH
jgi:hypothetical protein